MWFDQFSSLFRVTSIYLLAVLTNPVVDPLIWIDGRYGEIFLGVPLRNANIFLGFILRLYADAHKLGWGHHQHYDPCLTASRQHTCVFGTDLPAKVNWSLA